MTKSRGYVPGGLTTAPVHPNIRLGENRFALSKEQRRLTQKAMAYLANAQKSTDASKARKYLSEVYRIVGNITVKSK